MGWYAGWSKKKNLIVHLLQDYDGGVHRIKTLDWKVKREDGISILWRLVEVYDKQEAKRFNTIFLYVLDKFNEGWGYKDMEVSMGPYYYSCPKKFLKLAPPLNDWDRKWREKIKNMGNQPDDEWEAEEQDDIIGKIINSSEWGDDHP